MVCRVKALPKVVQVPVVPLASLPANALWTLVLTWKAFIRNREVQMLGFKEIEQDSKASEMSLFFSKAATYCQMNKEALQTSGGFYSQYVTMGIYVTVGI